MIYEIVSVVDITGSGWYFHENARRRFFKRDYIHLKSNTCQIHVRSSSSIISVSSFTIVQAACIVLS